MPCLRRGFRSVATGMLRRPFGRVMFAGEHTSIQSEGFMNGAIESGYRAAAEIAALAAAPRRLTRS